MSTCTNDSHARLKLSDPLRVATGTYQGEQDDGAGHVLALHDCPIGCGSTLAIDTRTVKMWTAVREAGNYAAEGNVEACLHEIARAGEWARLLASSLEWEAQEERARQRRMVEDNEPRRTLALV